MNDNILSTSGKAFQKFISHLTQKLTRPKAKFIGQLLCGVLFSNNLILTNIASKVPCPGRLTARPGIVVDPRSYDEDSDNDRDRDSDR